jgi:Zn-dependent protease with chaperone function
MRTSILFVSALATTLAACGGRTAPGNLKHNTVEPVRHEAKAWMWANDTFAEYQAMGNPSDPTSLKSGKVFLPETHALTKRLQAWIDELDALVRAQDPVRMAMVPKPVIHVEVVDEANAFVTAIPVCYDNVSLRFDGTKYSGIRNRSKFLAVYDDGQFYGGVASDGETPAQSKDCRHATISMAELTDRVQTLNAVHTSCRLTPRSLANGQLEVVAGQGCFVSGSLENAEGAAIFATMATSRHVTIFSGLLKQLGEAETVSVLAHELGHYYRPHISSGNAAYNFAYDLSGFNPSSRPVEKAGTADLRQAGEETRATFGVMGSRVTDLTTNVPESALQVVDGLTLHQVTLATVSELIQLYSTSSAFECETAMASLEGLQRSGAFPFDQLKIALKPLTAAQKSSLVDYETKALACLDAVRVENTTILPRPIDAMESATAASPLARKGAKPIPTTGTLKSWIQSIDLAVRDGYARVKIEPATNFSLDNLNAAVSSYMSEYYKARSQANAFEARKLGLYTPEQEADELAAEWMHGLKFDAKIPGNVDMAFIKLFESDDKYNECNAIRATGWKNADNTAAFVTWSDMLLDPHPGSCFRVRDQDLEAVAHGYVTNPGDTRTVPNPEEWKRLVTGISAPARGLTITPALAIASKSHRRSGPFKDAKSLGCRFNSHH